MKIGDCYILTEGCYSDYGICAVLVALCDFDWDKTVEEIVTASQNDDETAVFVSTTTIIDTLIARGLVKHDDKIVQLHMGEYGNRNERAEANALGLPQPENSDE